MKLSILIFLAGTLGIRWLLRRYPQHVVSRAALYWIGPRPVAGQTWATFQLRWARYSFGWFSLFALAFYALFLVTPHFPSIGDEVWFRIAILVMPLGIGMATLAAIGFLVKAAKARWIGPNPT